MTDCASRVQQYLHMLESDTSRDDLRVKAGGLVIAQYMGFEVSSAFQPIAVADGTRTTGVQALARVAGQRGVQISPADLFAMATEDDALVALDRRCRFVHTLNFFRGDPPLIDLYLNVHPRLLTAVSAEHGRTYRGVLESLRIPPRRVVIQLPALDTVQQVALHSHVIGSYRVNGFRVASAPSDPSLLQKLLGAIGVDVVRIDAQALGRQDWSAALGLARAAGAEVHITRVETFAHQTVAREAGATHLQGWLIGAATADAGRPALISH